MKGTHYYNSKTQNWIFKDSNGQFHTGWKLYPSQREDLLRIAKETLQELYKESSTT